MHCPAGNTATAAYKILVLVLKVVMPRITPISRAIGQHEVSKIATMPSASMSTGGAGTVWMSTASHVLQRTKEK
jgi:hypothetical protein